MAMVLDSGWIHCYTCTLEKFQWGGGNLNMLPFRGKFRFHFPNVLPPISRVQTGKEKNAPISDSKAIFPHKRTFVTKDKNKPILMHLTRQNFESSFVYDNHSSLSSTLESIVPLAIFLSQMLHPFIVLTKANCLVLSIWQPEHNSIKLACHY